MNYRLMTNYIIILLFEFAGYLDAQPDTAQTNSYHYSTMNINCIQMKFVIRKVSFQHEL